MPCSPEELHKLKMALRKERAKRLRRIGRKDEARILENENVGRAEFKEMRQDTEEETAMLLKNCNSRMVDEDIARRDALNALRHIQTKELKKATKAYKKLEKKKRKRETRKDKKLRKKQRHAKVANMLQGSQNGLPALDLSGSGSAGGGFRDTTLDGKKAGFAALANGETVIEPSGKITKKWQHDKLTATKDSG